MTRRFVEGSRDERIGKRAERLAFEWVVSLLNELGLSYEVVFQWETSVGKTHNERVKENAKFGDLIIKSPGGDIRVEVKGTAQILPERTITFPDDNKLQDSEADILIGIGLIIDGDDIESAEAAFQWGRSMSSAKEDNRWNGKCYSVPEGFGLGLMYQLKKRLS